MIMTILFIIILIGMGAKGGAWFKEKLPKFFQAKSYKDPNFWGLEIFPVIVGIIIFVYLQFFLLKQ